MFNVYFLLITIKMIKYTRFNLFLLCNPYKYHIYFYLYNLYIYIKIYFLTFYNFILFIKRYLQFYLLLSIPYFIQPSGIENKSSIILVFLLHLVKFVLFSLTLSYFI